MKHHLTFLLVFTLSLWAFSAVAQDAAQPAASVYTVSEVAVDVTADSAAKARDQAIAEAQRSALGQLLDRLGVDSKVGSKLSNDDLSTLVKNFEVSNEHASSVRYIGTFAVNFRPLAVRNFLGSKNAKFDDAVGKAVLVLPVTKDGAKTILWDEPTRWLKAWSETSKNGGIIPIIVPQGSVDDKATINAIDAAMGKVESIKNLIDKYHADAAYVAVLNGSPDNPTAGFTVDLQHFGTGFDDGSDIEHIKLADATDTNAIDGILKQGINQIRHKIEKDEKKKQQEMVQPATPTAAQPLTWSDQPAPSTLPVSVQFGTLAEWADIQRRLMASKGVRRVDVTSLGRGSTEIELGFEGTPQDIQMAVAEHGLRLTQDVLSGQWLLKGP